ncbi:winged helix DNA-binding protein [Microbacterium sp. P5_E9]
MQAQTIGKTLMRLEAYGYVVRQRSQSDRRSQVVSITAAGTSAREEARDLERSVLANADVDTDTLRTELQAIVRGLAAQAEETTHPAEPRDPGS